MQKQRAFSMCISRGVIVATPEATAVELAQSMEEHDIGAVVITRKDRVIGIVSERDITRRVVAKRLSADKTLARNVMTKKVVTAEFKDGLNRIYQILCHSKFRHLPITERGKLVGIASQRDVLYGVVPKRGS